ncbi:alkaline phosphatase D family protein [Streptomyces scabiei]|uniref:alkaline phosphatase D family protein n=1 Tax=Streptomyces scabiei TaxID=1930 RepID=UPI0039EFB0F4
MSVVHVWAGATTDTTAWVRGKVTGSSTRLAVDTDPGFGSPAYFGPDTPTADGMVSLIATGLTAGTRYYYALEDDSVLDTAASGQFRTHPVAAGERASYIIGAAGDAGLTGAGDDSYITDEVSDNPVFDTMRAQAASEEWLWFSHLGDLHYRNISTATASLYRDGYDDTLTFNGAGTTARQGQFLRDVAMTYVWDDHDFGPNNSDRTAAGNATANSVYRERVPHYTLPGASSGIFQSWQVGRVLYVVSDCRTFRDPNSDPQTSSKTMLGTDQKAWLEALLTTAKDSSGAQALVWQSSSRWIGGSDTWSSFLHERDEIVQLFGDTGWLHRMIMLTADEHALGISSGPNNPYGAFPMFMLASMDSDYTTDTDDDEPIYNLGRKGGRQQYGTLRVTDSGHTIALTGTGYRLGTALMAHTAYVQADRQVIALDYDAGHISPPFQPTDDDQRLRNEITAERVDGGEFTFSKTSGPNNTGDPDSAADAVGVYDDSVDVNVADDEQLPSQAAWRVHQGTVDEDRYPMVHVDLAAAPDLADTLTAMQLGDRVTIANPPEWLPPDLIDLIVEGGTEPIGHPNDWDMELNASPGSPWTVAQLPGPQALLDGLAEDFEDTHYMVTITDGGNLPWTRTSAQFHAGAWSLRSGAIGNNQTSDAIVSVPGWATSLSFWYRTSSETSGPGFEGDRLLVLVDGVQVLRAQGTVGWTQFTTDVTDKSAVTFRYAKDNSATAGEDAVYIDDLDFTAPLSTIAGPAGPNRADTSGSHLVTTVASTATEMIVHTPPDGIFDRAPWIVSAALSDAPNLRDSEYFPFDLRLGGEVVRASGASPFHYDSFTRTVAAGSWGTSDGGQAWSLVGGSNSEREVNGSRGLVTLPSSPSTLRLQTLPTSLEDCEIRARLSVDQVATGAALVPGILLRYTGASDWYQARIHFSTSGSMLASITRDTTQIGSSVALPRAYSAGNEFDMRVRIIGHRILQRVWPAGTTEPDIWHNDQTITTNTLDSGQVGTTASALAGNTNVNPVCRFDNFEVVTPQRLTVARSINTVAKAQSADTPISLDQPARLAL